MQLFIHSKIIPWQFGSSKALGEWPFKGLVETQMNFFIQIIYFHML